MELTTMICDFFQKIFQIIQFIREEVKDTETLKMITFLLFFIIILLSLEPCYKFIKSLLIISMIITCILGLYMLNFFKL